MLLGKLHECQWEVLHVAEWVPAVQTLKLNVRTPLWASKEALLLLTANRDGKNRLWDVSDVGGQPLVEIGQYCARRDLGQPGFVSSYDSWGLSSLL